MASENFEIIDGYLCYWNIICGKVIIQSIRGMIIIPKTGNGALFVEYRSQGTDFQDFTARFEVNRLEGISENGLVWYREPPADGTEPGDQYTIRKAFADEIERKIFELGNRIDKLKEEKEKMINGE